MGDIDHTCTDEIVCPYCGHTHQDSWELSGDSGETECEECGKPLWYERNVRIDYTTREIKKEAADGNA